MSVEKHVLVLDRVRRLPSRGWSWIDRRFLREYADSLERDSILLYFFLAAVADKHGLSYYGDAAISSRLRLDKAAVARCRDELVDRDLAAYKAPLYQVLSLPESKLRRGGPNPALIGDIMEELARGAKASPAAAAPRSNNRGNSSD